MMKNDKRMDTIAVVTRAVIVMALFLITFMVIAEKQHQAIEEQQQTIELQRRLIGEKDSLIDIILDERDSLQLIIGVDND